MTLWLPIIRGGIMHVLSDLKGDLLVTDCWTSFHILGEPGLDKCNPP